MNKFNKNNVSLLFVLLVLSSTTLLLSCGSTNNSTTLPETTTSGEWEWWDDDIRDDVPPVIIEYNTIDYTKDYYNYFDSLDQSSSKYFDSTKGTQRYEGELCASLSGEAKIQNDKYLGYLQNEATVTFKIKSKTACKALIVGNLSTNPDKDDGVWFDSQYLLQVNNEEINTSDCWILPTFSWSNFKINPIASINLTEGENIITFTCYEGLSNIDYISLSPLKEDVVCPVFDYSKGMIVEAENCLITNCTIESNSSLSNGQNIGYLSSKTKVEFIINCESSVETTIYGRTLMLINEQYSNIISDRFSLKVNEQEIDINDLVANPTSAADWWLQSYYSVNLCKVTLNEGENRFVMMLSPEMNLDYIKLD